MRFIRIGAFALTAACLVVAALWMLLPVGYTICVGGDCTKVSCGSPAFPKELSDFDQVDDATNCAGLTSASVSLYGLVLAGVGLGAVALTSRRGRSRLDSASASTSSQP